jgi:hypothetical protein
MPALRRSACAGYLSDDPLQSLVFVAFIMGSHLRIHEHSDCAYHPMLCAAITAMRSTF